MSKDCDEITQHKTGKCEKCRTYRCIECGRGVISSAPTMSRNPRCTLCARTKKLKVDRLEPDEDEYFQLNQVKHIP